MATILKGAPVVAAMNERNAALCEQLKAKGITPTLAVVRVGEREDDLSYERGVIARCGKVGVEVKQFLLPADASQDDLLKVIAEVNAEDTIHGCLPVCCQEEESRKVVSAAVARLLGTSQIDPHAASLSGQRQLSAALRARDAVAGALDAAAGGFGLDAVSVCVDDALAALCDLTGENASEAVIEQVFERFCVGK